MAQLILGDLVIDVVRKKVKNFNLGLLERGHNQRFYAFMDQFLLHWRLLKEELNRSTTAILSED